MSFNRYYQDELTYLRELGAEFARENPNLAPFLSRDASDPDVERLIESFAFLTGRIRQKLDDELPELSHSLVALLWPNLLRPVPSMAIVELEPLVGAITATQRLAAGAEFQADPIDGTACSFRSTIEVAVHPVTVSHAAFEPVGTRSTLTVTLAPIKGAKIDGLALEPLRFYLSFERDGGIGRLLLLWLSRRLSGIRLTGAGGYSVRLPASAVRPVGFDERESLLPHPPQAFRGHVLLQEYLAFPQKFMFFDLAGLPPATELPAGDWTLEFEFDGIPEEAIRISAANIRLNCVPVINLFSHEAEPIDVNYAKTEYRVVPSGDSPGHYAIFSIDRVMGWERGRGERIEYTAFEDFLHAIDGEQSRTGYYRARLRPAVARPGIDTFIALVDQGGPHVISGAEVVSAQLTCTNGSLAETLPVGGIRRATAKSPTYARFRNISQVSPQSLPPLDAQLLWRLIANLSVAPGTLLSIPTLRTLIGSLDFAALTDQRARRRLELRLGALGEIKARPTDLMMPAGYVLRGVEIELSLEEVGTGGEGEAFLFGSVLDAFLSEASNVNSFHRLIVRGTERNWRYTWAVRHGAGSLL